MHAHRILYISINIHLLLSCFTTGSYLGLTIVRGEDAFWVVIQIHVFHNVVHSISHFLHFIEREEAFDDKKAICLVLKGIHYIVMRQEPLRVKNRTNVPFQLALGKALQSPPFLISQPENGWKLVTKVNEQLTDLAGEGSG